MDTIRFYHNPRCSKSREALGLLNEKGQEPEIVLYLENPPSAEELRSILAKLEMSAFDILRKADLKKEGLDVPDSEEQLIELMVSHPRIIERPIAVCEDSAVIGRPPENVLSLLK